MTHRNLLLVCLISLLFCAGPQSAKLEPSPQHDKVSRLVTTLFERSHYSNAQIDNALSSKILDRYLDALDPNRMYLTESDVDKFEKYRFKLDDAVKRGDMDPVFDIFSHYRQRLRSTINSAVVLLDSELDFTDDERHFFYRRDKPRFRDQADLDEFWRKRVKNDMLSLILTGKDWEEAAGILRKRYDRMLTRSDQLNSDEVFESFMNAYAGALDPYSNYFSPRNSEENRWYKATGTSLKLIGDYVTVVDVLPGGPAAIDGRLQKRDRITGVGQGDEPEIIDVVGWRLDDVIQLIRGPGGTVVRLQILPAGAAPGSAEQIVELKRDNVTLEAQAAQKSTIEVDRAGRKVSVGVIDIPSFYQDFKAKTSGDKNFTSMTRDVSRLIGELREEGIEGLVLDLRGNGGGHLSEATALSGLFIDDGPIVQLKYSSGRKEILHDKQPGMAWDGPLVVLVDRYSAAASEILAGAIQDYGRGLVIGQHTYGDGSVQNLYNLDRYLANPNHSKVGQLTVTIGKIYRLTGEGFQQRGVEPDLELPSDIDAKTVGESSRNNALSWDHIDMTPFKPAGEAKALVATLLPGHTRRTATNPDYQFLLDSIAMDKAERDRNSVSLNMTQRKIDRDQRKRTRMKLENQRRVAHGLEPLVSLAESQATQMPDVLLQETAQLIGDIVTQQNASE